MKKHTRFLREVYVFPHSFTGALAKAAVSCSPYVVPDNLSVGIEKFNEKVKETFDFDSNDMALVSLNDLSSIIEPILWNIPEIAAWNDRKNGRDGMGFTDRYSAKPDPDDDFIDIGALAQNITCDFADSEDANLWCEHTRDENKITLEDIPMIDAADLRDVLDGKIN